MASTSGAIVIHDAIYGKVVLPKLCADFMNTPEFQRLRRVKQLGTAYYAFPSAVHTRFEHSIGVAHLAGKMALKFIDKFSARYDMPISLPRLVDLIQLAGLYHDIGHLAYSHLFDSFLETKEVDFRSDLIFTYFNHESRSIYFLRKVNLRLQLLTSQEEHFVSNCILGIIPDNDPPFPYEIVNNRFCGVDVDKLDYLQRDPFHCGLKPLNAEKIFRCADIDEDEHLAFRYEAREAIVEMFLLRKQMFQFVYHHPIVQQTDRIHLCMMERLGKKLFQYGEWTDDHNIDTLIRSVPELKSLVYQLDHGNFEHECEYCQKFRRSTYRDSGNISRVSFIGKPMTRSSL